MSTPNTRIEKDSMGELEVPIDALYGPQTQRAVNNFPISNLRMPRAFIRALGLIKKTAAMSNWELGLLPEDKSKAIIDAASRVARGEFDKEFPVDVFQTGSGTSSNMNANEVIANLACEITPDVHPNDHVNMGQSSNDVIPTAIHVSCAIELHDLITPAFDHAIETLEKKAKQLEDVVKTGRTHLMDAMPVTFGQELRCWAELLKNNKARFDTILQELCKLPIGGTAVGTGINAHPEFSAHVCQHLSENTLLDFSPMPNLFVGISTQDTVVALSGECRLTAVTLMKIANDLRWMNSGPLAGLGEISLPAVQPGSSIMPGKVNPVIPEAVCMVAAHVMGNDAAIAIGGQAGNFQLNVMLPMIAYNAIQSIELLANALWILVDSAIADFSVNHSNINACLAKNPILVTALNAVIGYEKGAEIAKRAYQEGRPIKEVALEMTDLSAEELDKLLDPAKLTQGGLQQ